MAKRKRTTLTESSTFVVQHAYGLLALPAELRNRIWEYALSDLEVEIPRRSSVNRRGAISAPGLLRACKQTYLEAASLFYSSAIFSVWDSRYYIDGTLSRLPDWLARIGPLRTQLISEIRIYTQFEGFNNYERFVEWPSGPVEPEHKTCARVARSALARTRHAVRNYNLDPTVLKVNVGSPRRGVWTCRPMTVEQDLERPTVLRLGEQTTRDLDSPDWDSHFFDPLQWTFCIWSSTHFGRLTTRERTVRRTK